MRKSIIILGSLAALAAVLITASPVKAQCRSCQGAVCLPGGFAAPPAGYSMGYERFSYAPAPAWSGGVYSAPSYYGGCPCVRGYSIPSYPLELQRGLPIPRVEEFRHAPPREIPREKLHFRPRMIVRRFR